jgi:hypothetical protein
MEMMSVHGYQDMYSGKAAKAQVMIDERRTWEKFLSRQHMAVKKSFHMPFMRCRHMQALLDRSEEKP